MVLPTKRGNAMCWKGEPGERGRVDPNYRFKLETAPHEDPNFIKELIADMQKKLTPNNCSECPYTNICPAPHYLADECKYKN